MEQLKIAPFKSIVDVSFFVTLSDKKLNELKLSESSVSVYANYGIPVSSGKPPTIELTGDAFDYSKIDETIPYRYRASGFITNVNTIESFKEFNKAKFMQNEGDELAKAIINGDIDKDPSILSRFHILAYSDLKKYKFTYWFAFPAVVVDWNAESVSQNDDNELLEAIDEWKKTVDRNEWGFYLLKRIDNKWVVGSINQVDNFWNGNDKKCVGFEDASTIKNVPSWPIRNFMAYLGTKGVHSNLSILCQRDHSHLRTTTTTKSGFWINNVTINTNLNKEQTKVTGWERNNDKLAPKFADLNGLLDPKTRADQSVDLNLRLMKWRVAPELDLDGIKNSKCLLLGAGTLGSYIARGLLGWGVKNITFVDSGRVSFSNPVRQPLYNYEDCLEGGSLKALKAAEALKKIYPSVESEGHVLEIPMAGHPLTEEGKQNEDYIKLVELIKQHDVIFLLMDSRESRWLPTVITTSLKKLVINVALGFDSSVVMRHGIIKDEEDRIPHLGCYFCNDVVAPIDSVSNQTLDQMCTVTRPGIAMSASAEAVELFASILQHSKKGLAPAGDEPSVLSLLPHQLRRYLHNFETMKVWGPSFKNCSACSPIITGLWEERGWDFVKQALNEPGYVELVSGLKAVQDEAAKLDEMGFSASEEEEEDVGDDKE